MTKDEERTIKLKALAVFVSITQSMDVKKLAACYFVSIVLFILSLFIFGVATALTGVVVNFFVKLVSAVSWLMMVAAILLILGSTTAAAVRLGRRFTRTST